MAERLRPGARSQSNNGLRPVSGYERAPLVWGTSLQANQVPTTDTLRLPNANMRAASFVTSRAPPDVVTGDVPRGNPMALLKAKRGVGGYNKGPLGSGYYKGLGSGSLMSSVSKPEPTRPNRLMQAVLQSREAEAIPLPIPTPTPDDQDDEQSDDVKGSSSTTTITHELIPPLVSLTSPDALPTPPCIEIELASEYSSTSSTKSRLFSVDAMDMGQLTVPGMGNQSRYQSFILGRSFTNIRQTKEVECGMCSVSGYEIINQYVVLDECIGKGASGEVAMVVDSGSNTQYALKTINRSRLMNRMDASPCSTPRSSASCSPRGSTTSCVSTKDGLLGVGPVVTRVRSMELGYGTNREVAIMKKARHPNLVRLHEVIDDPHHGKLYLVMELLEKPVCSDFSMVKGTCTPADPELLKRYLYEVLSGLSFLHRNNIVHRDLKPDNMMLNQKGEVVLIDFGVSEVADDDTIVSGFAGTPAFIAPEVWNASQMLGPATDVWSLGVCFYMLLVGRTPFTGSDRAEMLEAIVNNDVEFPPGTSQEWQDCIGGMLVKDPAERTTIDACRALPMLVPIAIVKREELAERRKVDNEADFNATEPSPSRRPVVDDVTQEDVEVAVSLRCGALTDESEAARRFVMRSASSLSSMGRGAAARVVI